MVRKTGVPSIFASSGESIDQKSWRRSRYDFGESGKIPNKMPVAVDRPHRHGTGRRLLASDNQDRLNHLITVAGRIFLSKGYEATSLDSLAEAVGVSKTTIYHNFGDKAGLFRAVLNYVIPPIWPKLSSVSSGGQSPQEVLISFGHGVLTSVLSPDAIALLRLVYWESSRFPELGQAFGEAERAAVDVVAEYLSSAIKQRQLNRTDPVWAASQFLELIWGTLVRRLIIGTASLPDKEDCERVVDSAVAVFLNGYFKYEEST
ncbi:TetR/AcrR family transcriptional regulator [Telmatospirillum sp.]|uniref:TetR/AcrR family transcriptional regulator n=1 Tax=Telmatospirillum sp. TaxID=2079197 RepID=UPI0028459CCB|nr:TetR/AcrR family transcriptional regulator [Telmatospirillum sp.]MDR3440319.1 TetR/AcrR family transcriptional regulator [Telmatospirillum sp.]